MCSTDTHAKTDVCVIDQTSVICLVVQEDKQYLKGKDSEPQLIAEAIAAFLQSSIIRSRTPHCEYCSYSWHYNSWHCTNVDVMTTLVDAVKIG